MRASRIGKIGLLLTLSLAALSLWNNPIPVQRLGMWVMVTTTVKLLVEGNSSNVSILLKTPPSPLLKSPVSNATLQPINQSETVYTPIERDILSTSKQSVASPTESLPSHTARPNDTLQLCTREEIQRGEWVPITLPEIPYVPHLRCKPADHYKNGTPWTTWDWQPFAVKAGNCTLLHWNSSHFCSLAKHATIAIVGDSLSWEQYASLAQMLGQTVDEKQQIDFIRLGRPTLHYACQGEVRLLYFRNDYLQNISSILQGYEPNVLVINRGAHYVNDTDLEADLGRISGHLQQWQTSCQTSVPHRPCHLFVRTSVPGHPHCWKFKAPTNSLEDMEAHVHDPNNYKKQNHFTNWREFQRQNQLSLRVYQQEQANLTLDVLDAYYINILRPDDHLQNLGGYGYDCLHSCYPGKADLYNQLLYHFLHKRGGIVSNEDVTWTSQTVSMVAER